MDWIFRFMGPRTHSVIHYCDGSETVGWFLRSTVSQSAVKTNLLINPIDQSKNRGKCDLHTAGTINALTDFSSPFFSPNLISSVFKVRERESGLMPIDPPSHRHEYKAFYYAAKGRNILGTLWLQSSIRHVRKHLSFFLRLFSPEPMAMTPAVRRAHCSCCFFKTTIIKMQSQFCSVNIILVH